MQDAALPACQSEKEKARRGAGLSQGLFCAAIVFSRTACWIDAIACPSDIPRCAEPFRIPGLSSATDRKRLESTLALMHRRARELE
jgi:hypothetical protein